jgi:hypothetical protein
MKLYSEKWIGWNWGGKKLFINLTDFHQNGKKYEKNL